MPEMTPGTALRQLQTAQGQMRKARKALLMVREAADRPDLTQEALRIGWDSLTRTHRELAAIPVAAATEAVMTKQLAVQRYATSLLVRLRRLVRNEPGALDGLDEEDEDSSDLS